MMLDLRYYLSQYLLQHPKRFGSMNPSVTVLHLFFLTVNLSLPTYIPPDVSKEISDVSMGMSPTIFNLQEYSQTKILIQNPGSV